MPFTLHRPQFSNAAAGLAALEQRARRGRPAPLADLLPKIGCVLSAARPGDAINSDTPVIGKSAANPAPAVN